jgi:hypothetical protein
MAKATENQLGDLHAEVAKQLKELLQNEPGNLAAINASLKFLKDNRIEAEPDNVSVHNLKLALPDERDFSYEELHG